MKSKRQRGASHALLPANVILPIPTGVADLSKGCPLMFTNQAETNCSEDAPQFEHDSTAVHVGESAW